MAFLEIATAFHATSAAFKLRVYVQGDHKGLDPNFVQHETDVFTIPTPMTLCLTVCPLHGNFKDKTCLPVI